MRRSCSHQRPVRRHHWLLPAACGVLFSAASLADVDLSVPTDFDLEAQSLKGAMKQWRAQSGVRFILDCSSATLRSSAVTGRFTPEEALVRMLTGTGATYSFLNHTAAIKCGKKRPDAAPSRQARPRDNIVIPLELESVTVTGTKIPGSTPVGEDVKSLALQIGQPPIERMIQARPEFIRGGVDGDSADARLSLSPRSSGNIMFASAPNLRALGSSATLMLLNGRRIALSGQGLADLSAIPGDAVLRVDVLTGGASAIYGTDAVGGVVNYILKEEPDPNTRVRYGATTRSGLQEVSASQTLGTTGDRGSFIGVASYENQTALTVDERDWTADVPRPENIYPSDKQFSLYLAGHYDLSDSWTVRALGLHTEFERYASGFSRAGHWEFPISSGRTHGALSAHYDGDKRWKLSFNGNFSREDTDFSILSIPPGSSAPDVDQSEVQRLAQTLWALSVEANRAIELFPSVSLQLAIGAERRKESYASQLRSPEWQRRDADRTVDAAYLELQIPLVNAANRRTGVEALTLSLASRYEKYTDIDGVNNPKFAVSWTPIEGIEVRSTLGWSLRAPTVGEELSRAARGTESRVGIYSFTSPDGSTTQPVALLSGSRQLEAETARHWTAGLVVRPPGFEGLSFGVTYFDVDYSDRIVAAPVNPEVLRNPDLQNFVRTYATPAQLQAELMREAGGTVEYIDRTGTDYDPGEVGRPQDAATVIYDGRLTNAALLRTSGFDVDLSYSTGNPQTGQLQLNLLGTVTSKMETQFAPGARLVDAVGTTGYPARLKVLFNAAFLREVGWSAAAGLRVMDSYTDTSGDEHRRVRSSLIADAQVSYTFSSVRAPAFGDVSVALAVENLFDEDPPYIAGSSANRHSHYDTANAEPLGRLLSLEIRKRW